MGLFDKFKAKKKNVDFLMPIDGKIIEITEIPDPVFAGKMMGDGFGIQPKNGKVYSPVTGKVESVFPTLHAIGLKVNDDIEVLIHFGLDTVTLKGEGFTCHVEQGQMVNAGDLLLEVNLDEVESKVPSIITPIIFTKLEGHSFEINYGEYDAKDASAITIK